MQDNCTYYTTRSFTEDSWNRLLGGDGGYSFVSRVGIFYYASFQNGQIYRLSFGQDNQLSSFARVDPQRRGQDASVEFIFVTPYVLDPGNSNLMYLAGSDVIWKNHNLAQIPGGSQEPTSINWQKWENTRLNFGTITAINISTHPANVLYYGSSTGKVFKISDASQLDPQPVEITSPQFTAGAYVSCIAVDPSDAEQLMVIFSNYNVISIFYSDDGGNSFMNISGNLEDNPDGTGNGPSIRWGQIMPLADGNAIFAVGTSTGVYTTALLEGVNTIWARESPGLIGNVVVPMMDYRSLDGQLVVATHGNGVYSKKFAGVKVVEPPANQPQLEVKAAYPNPFLQQTTISLNLPFPAIVKADIFNSSGQIVKNLFLGYLYAGDNQISWDGTDESGTLMTNGNYIIRMEYNGNKISKQVIFQR